MPTKAKPSNWKPPTVEGAFGDFDDAAHIGEIHRIVAALPPVEDPQRALLRAAAYKERVDAFLHSKMTGRPKQPEKLAAITKLRRLAIELTCTLADLDFDTRRLLGSQTIRGDTVPADLQLSEDVHRLGLLRQRLRTARRTIQPAAGRPRRDDLQQAAINLRKAWKDAYGKEPALGEFLAFVRAVLGPVVGGADFEGYCRKALYEIE